MATKKSAPITDKKKATGTKTATPIKSAASGAVTGGVAKLKKTAKPITGTGMKKTATPRATAMKKTSSPLSGGGVKMKKAATPRKPLTVQTNSRLNKYNY